MQQQKIYINFFQSNADTKRKEKIFKSLFKSCVIEKHKKEKTEEEKAKIRKRVHLAFTVLFFFIVLYFRWLNEKTIVDLLMDLAGYTYGPLLGLFAFGILTQRVLIGSKWNVVVICLLSPVLTYLLALNSKAWFFGYEMGAENLIVNGAITFGLLYLRSSSRQNLA